MQADHNPNPQRFQVFIQLPNGKGFKIKNSKYIYFFDKFGGWYDQYNNYYNCDGQPEDPPSDQDDQFQRVILQDQYDVHDQDDYYDRQYGGQAIQDNYQQDLVANNNQHQKVLQAIANNQTILHQYPVKTPLRVDFQNMSFKAKKPQILKHYRNKVGSGLLNVILTLDHGQFTGQGYFVCKQVSTAQKLIKYEGQQFQSRKVYFDVQPLQENLLQPVTRQQMDIAINQDDFQSLVKQKPVETKPVQTKQQLKSGKKKYFAKNATTQSKKQQTKPQNTQSKQQSPKKQVKTQPKPIAQQKIQQVKKQQKKEPTWAKYYGEVTMFPKKISFKEWMLTFGFKEMEHFKNPEKAESKDNTKKFATVELRSDVYQRIEGVMYQGVRVSFKKLD